MKTSLLLAFRTFIFQSNQNNLPTEQTEELLRSPPALDLCPGVGILAELNQDPGDAPQQLQVPAVQEAQQNRHPLQLL